MADGPVPEVLLRRLEAADGGLDSAEVAAQLGLEHQAVVGAVKSLQTLGEVSRALQAGPPGFCICSSLARCLCLQNKLCQAWLGVVVYVSSPGCAGGESGINEGPDVPTAVNVH